MAKNLLLTVLVKVLGKYVEGLTNENLQIGVFSGQIEFNNLKLKDSALDQLELPIEVKKGCLKHLRVSIPWTQLDSRPVEIEIDGVYLLATPLDLSQCTPEISKKMVYNLKQKKLQEIQETILNTLKQEEEKEKLLLLQRQQSSGSSGDNSEEKNKESSSSSSGVSYVQQLVTSIIDNLEVRLRNIHIRYEDASADYGQLFCVGITLDELLLATSDETWTTKFVKREGGSNSYSSSQQQASSGVSAIHKLGKIVNCGIYWNSFGESHLLKSDSEWDEFFTHSVPTTPKLVTVRAWERHKKNILWFWLFLVVMTFMATGSLIGVAVVTAFVGVTAMRPVKPSDEQLANTEQQLEKNKLHLIEQGQQYILAPPNNLTLKITHRSKCTALLPKVDVALESSEMPFLVDKDQLRQIMALKKSFGDLDRKLQMAMYRPAIRPKQNVSAREWWKYAYRLVTGRDVSFTNKINMMTACARAKANYVSYIKHNHIQSTLAQNKGGKYSPQYQEEIRVIEEMLPLVTLVAFRDEALRAAAVEIKKQESSEAASDQSTVGYLSSWFSPQEVDGDDSSAQSKPQNSADKEDIALMSAIESKLQQLNQDSSAVANEAFSLRVAVHTSSKLQLTYNRVPFVNLQMALSFGMEMKYGNMSMKLGMDNFSIEDICSAKPYSKYLICMAPIEDIASQSGSATSAVVKDTSRSQFELLFDIESTKSTMVIRALPLIITWNKHCLQHLLGFVLNGTADNSEVNNNPMLKTSMESFSAETPVADTDLFIKINIDAPKIILPEDMGHTERCTILDTGTLVLDGLMNANGMKWDINLKNINIAMPLTRQSMNSRAIETSTSGNGMNSSELYLIRPFDISAIIAKNDKISSELSVESRVDPEIIAEVSSEKVVRLGLAVAALLSGLNSDKAEIRTKSKNKANNVVIGRHGTMPTTSTAATTTSSTVATVPISNTNPNPSNVNKDEVGLAVTFLLDRLALRLTFTTDSRHFVEVAFTKIEYKLFKRLYDTTMTCTLNSLTVTDSQRSSNFPYLLLAQPDARTSNLSNLFSLTMRSFANKASSLYCGNESDMSINISVINLYLDDKTTLGYKYLVNELFTAYNDFVVCTLASTCNAAKAKAEAAQQKKNARLVKNNIEARNEDEQSSDEEESKAAVVTPVTAPTITSAAVNPLGGSSFEVSLERVSLHVLNHITDTLGHITENAFSLNLNDFHVGYHMHELSKGFATLHSVEIIDTRSMTTSPLYRTLLGTDIDNHDKLMIMEGSERNTASSEHMIHVDFDQVTNYMMRIDVNISYPSVTVNLDVIMDLVGLVMTNVDAWMSVIASFNEDDRSKGVIEQFGEDVGSDSDSDSDSEAEAPSVKSKTAATTSLSSQPNELLVRLGLLHPQILLIEDPKSSTSRAIVSKCNVEVKYRKVFTESIKELGEEIYLSLEEMQLIVLHDLSTPSQLHRTLDPINLELSLSKRSEQDIMLALNVMLIASTDILIRISLNDLLLINSIVDRMTASNDDSTNTQKSLLDVTDVMVEESEKLAQAESTWQFPAVDVCIYSIDSTISKITIVLINDCNGQNNPLLRLETEKGTLEGRGPPRGWFGEGGVSISIDYYNVIMNVWEPVIEKWSPSLKLVKDGHGTEVVLKCVDSIQLNVTGTLLKCITNAAELASRSTEESRKYSTRSMIAPLRIANQLGVEVEIFDTAKDVSVIKLHNDLNLHDLITSSSNPTVVSLDWSRPRTLYMCFRDDEYAGLFAPLRQLSTASSTKPKIYHLQPSRAAGRRQSMVDHQVGNNAVSNIPYVVWDVVSKADESKEIYLRTSKVIVNGLDVPLEFCLGSAIVSSSSSGSNQIIEKSGGRCCIPLKYIHERVIRIRPAGMKCTWSEAIPTVLDPNRKDKGPEFLRVNFFDEYQVPSQVGIMIEEEQNGFVVITCSPIIRIINRLPSNVNLVYKNISKKLDSVALQAGESRSLLNCEVSSEIEIVPMVGMFSNSNKIKLPTVNEDVESVMKLLHERSNKSMFISLKVSMNAHHVCTLTIYSKLLLCDQSEGLFVSASTASATSSSGSGNSGGVGSWEAVTYNTTSAWEEYGVAVTNQGSDKWIYGINGLAMIQPTNGKFQLLLNQGSSQTNVIDIESLSSSKSKIDVFDQKANKTHSIAVQLKPYPPALDLTHILTITPAYRLVNAMKDQDLFFQQANGDDNSNKSNSNEGVDGFKLCSRSTSSWHPIGKKADSTDLYIRTSQSEWSVGKVDINDIGTSVLVLPRKSVDGDTESSHPIVLNVDVRFSDASDPSCITVTVWESKMWKDSLTNKIHRLGTITFSIRNDSQETIVIRQHAFEAMKVLKKLGRASTSSMVEDAKKFELVVAPGEWLAYGWSDQELNSKLDIACGNDVSTAFVDGMSMSESADGDSVREESTSSRDTGSTMMSMSSISMKSSKTPFEKAKHVVTISVDKVGQVTKLNTQTRVQVKTNAHGKYLHIMDSSNSADHETKRHKNGMTRRQSTLNQDIYDHLRENDLNLRIELDSIAISLIADRPNRREFLSLYLTGLELTWNQIFESEYENATTMLSFLLLGAQIDNYSQTAVYPVLLTTSATNGGGSGSSNPSSPDKASLMRSDSASVTGSDSGGNNTEFIYFMLVRENPKHQTMPILKYVGFRMLETHISIDSASILLYMSDLHRDLLEGLSPVDTEGLSAIPLTQSFNEAITKQQQELQELQRQWMLTDGGNNSTASSSGGVLASAAAMEVIEREYAKAQSDKIVIESLEIHPIKIVISFSPSHYPRRNRDIPVNVRWMTKIETVSPVEDFVVKIKSFIAKDAMESVSTLIDRIVQKIINDLTSNLLGLTKNLILSLNALGKPAGLYKKIGSGVEDFFYEPYQGLTRSPVHFVKGLGIGTSKLIKGVGGGVVGSTATIVTTATGGVAVVARNMATLTGDTKFIKRNEEKRREMMTSQGGALAGFKAAGESVFSGISSGISGLVTTPIEETKKKGAMGFFVGVGKGLVGVAVKPVIGVTEGIANVATGINQQFSTTVMIQHKRPPRALLRPEITSSDLILVNLDVFAAHAQQFVSKVAFKKNYSDTFLAALPIGKNSEDAKDNDPIGLIFSMKYIVLVSKTLTILNSWPVSTLSHVALLRLGSGYVLQFVEYSAQGSNNKGTEKNQNIVEFGNNINAAVFAYDCFVRYRTLFGCSAAMPPSEVVLDQLENNSNNNNSIGTAGTGGNRGRTQSQSSTAANSDAMSTAENNDNVSPMKEGMYGGLSDENEFEREGELNIISGASSIVPGGLQSNYVFGTANETKCVKNRLCDAQFKKIVQLYLAEVPIKLPCPQSYQTTYHEILDQIVWRSVFDWINNHDYIINPSRCCACLIINHSNSFIEIDKIHLKEGAEVMAFSIGPEGYDTEKQLINAFGGAVLLFGYGRRPSIVSKEHIKFEIHCNAFKSLVSTRVNSSNLHSSPGFNANFLEKTRTDWWGKFVISVT